MAAMLLAMKLFPEFGTPSRHSRLLFGRASVSRSYTSLVNSTTEMSCASRICLIRCTLTSLSRYWSESNLVQFIFCSGALNGVLISIALSMVKAFPSSVSK